jgi:uncharacterized membrane protein
MADHQPQCAALTADGRQCRNSSRGASRYCASHKGYQPPAGKGLAQRIEGTAWSATDRLSDRQSARNADTKPKVRKAEDTPLAVRSKGKAAGSRAAPKKGRRPARAPPMEAVTRAAVATPRRVQPDRDEGYVAQVSAGQRDYLVIYEEPDPDGLPADDALLLDIDAGQPVSLGEVDLEQKLDLELSNNTNSTGTVGFGLAILGALVAVVACIMFAVSYPDPWYTTSGALSGTGMIPATLIVGVLGALTMLVGVILTHYGRRIQARGNLSRMRIVEKSFQPRVALGDET